MFRVSEGSAKKKPRTEPKRHFTRHDRGCKEKGTREEVKDQVERSKTTNEIILEAKLEKAKRDLNELTVRNCYLK